MSIFKEKDDIIKAAFSNIFHSDSESDSESEVKITHDNSEYNNHAEQKEAYHSNQYGGDSFIKLDNGEEDNIQIEDKTSNCQKQPIPVTVALRSDESVEIIDVSKENDYLIDPPSGRGVLTRSQRKKVISSQNVITISDDDDDVVAIQTTTTVNNNRLTSTNQPPQTLNTVTGPPETGKVDDQEDEHDFNLKIIVAGSLERYRMKYCTKINDALKDMINDLRSENKCLILTFNDKVVPMEESPSSLKLTPGNILKAIVVSDPTRENSHRPGEITVKVQDGHRKHTMEFNILKNEPILELKSLYAKHFNVNNTDKIKLFFDGDMVEENLTPEELDIEDDCVLDVMVSN